MNSLSFEVSWSVLLVGGALHFIAALVLGAARIGVQ